MVDGCFSDPIPPAPLPTPSVPTPYIGSHRFSVLIETDPQNISPKKKYRDLKKKFKYLVYVSSKLDMEKTLESIL
jgi:hypothetical protein